MKLRIIYDNEAKEGLESDWGFSCLVEAEDKKILFDTGASGEILSHNMQRLRIRREDIEIIALSHEHWDHIGGLDAVLHQNVAVYIPRSFSRRTKKRIEESAAEVLEVSGPADIVSGVHTTGELGMMTKEQSLVLETKGNKGVVALTGCAHPGLETILEAAKVFGELYGVIGGFHGFDKLELLKELKMIIPCHCTVRKEEIRRMYQEKAVWCGAGEIIEI
jgi:7,8-dihydropterin-6-yl-methyl-4-(beta-D-ribofuranosyl)aminobenzene 5'-phosphate synthase